MVKKTEPKPTFEPIDSEQKAISLSGDPIVNEVIERRRRVQDWETTTRYRFVEDLKFGYGDGDNGYQWPAAIRSSRDTASKPSLTMNVVRQLNLNISNDLRKNKQTVKFIATGGEGSAESSEAIQDLFRYVERRSHAQDAYTKAREFQIFGGIGFIRLATDYVDNESFDQEVRILPVNDPLGVYMDPDAQQKNRSDMSWCIVMDQIPSDEFKAAYPEHKDKARTAALGDSTTDDMFLDEDHTLICEYFRKEPIKRKLVSYVEKGQRRTVRDDKLSAEHFDKLVTDPMTKIREVVDHQVAWYLIIGSEVVDSAIWPGKYIPIIPVIGEEIIVDGVLDRKGHTRYQKDAQRMYNYNAALACNTPIPTPDGWTTMGQLQAGNWIIGADGKPVQVTEALPIEETEAFEIEFDNGAKIVSDAGHIWAVEERGKRKTQTFEWKDVTRATEELVAKKHFIRISKPLDLPEAVLPIEPYVLGVWLGDGHSCDGRISAHIEDGYEQKRLLEECGYTTGELHGFVGLGTTFNVRGLKGHLRENGLLGEKFIPRQYLRGSFTQRLALLQGLMDTDGHYAKATNQCVFIQVDREIALAFRELCASLGIKSTLSVQPGGIRDFCGIDRKCQDAYRVQFTAPEFDCFRLLRKLNTQRMYAVNRDWRRTKRIGIKSIKPVGKRLVRCIKLDTPDHLYLAGEQMIPTHNSAEVEFVALQTKSPWLAPVAAIEGYETYWNTANTQNHSILPFKHVDDDGNPMPPPQRIEPPKGSEGFDRGMQTAFLQMQLTSGQFENQMGQLGNERTGSAIGKRQEMSATATYHFQDNYETALRWLGEQFLDLFPHIYDTKRVFTVLQPDGSSYTLETDPASRQGFFQELDHTMQVSRRVLNPLKIKFSVAPDVGPAYRTKNQETLDSLSLVLTQAPNLIPLIGDLLISSMPFDKAMEASQRLKRMVPKEALGTGPSQAEQQLMAQNANLMKQLQDLMQLSAGDKIKLQGKAEMRDIDAYKAESDRLKAVVKGLAPEQAQQVIGQLVKDIMGIELTPLVMANAQSAEMGGGESEGGGENKTQTQSSPQPEEEPPMAGARKAPDGKHYIPDGQGGYIRVEPRGEEEPPIPGAKRAPDGKHYIQHKGGWLRVEKRNGV